MRKTLLTLGIAAALAVPGLANGTSLAPKHYEAKQACKEERDADRDAFKERYANENGKHAFRRCVRQHVRQARRKCRAERDDGKAAFREKYGEENGEHAFHHCVIEHEGEPVAVADGPEF